MKKTKFLNTVLAGTLVLSSLTGCGNEKADNNAAENSQAGNTTYIYGTLDVPYADYYYGELNDVEPDTTSAGQYDVDDLVVEAGYEGEGMYDAVTSATTTKSKKFETTYTEDTDTGVSIIGIADVNVAITQELYDEVKKAIEDGTKCNNKLMDFVSNLEDISDTAPDEYKVLNSDGTLSKYVGEVTSVNATATMTTTSTWGNYQIDIEGLDDLDAQTVEGAVIETEDGAKYGLQHLDNLWLQPSEIAFSVKEFTDPHDNVAGYNRFADIEGKTISNITYIIKNGADISIDTSLYVKQQVGDEYSATADETVTYNAAGTVINYSLAVPEGSNYTLTDIIYSRKSLDSSLYTADDSTITLASDCGPGDYKLIFSDDNYSDVSCTTSVDSGLEAADITLDNNTLSINAEGLDVSQYIACISSVTVNDTKLSGKNLGSTIFNEDGSVNFEATTEVDGTEVKVFEGMDSYTLSLSATGFPDEEFTITQ